MAEPLQSISLQKIGQYGYYAEADARYNDERYAGTFKNCIFDKRGRVASRKGYDVVLATAISGTPDVKRLHYYRRDIGTADQWIAAADDDSIYKISGNAGSATSSDITGTITTPSSWDWQFVTYNDKVIGIQQGDDPIVYTGTGSFADFNAGATNLPDGNCLLSAWGRLWATTVSGQQINWTGVLGEDFDGAGSGQLNVRKVWPNGADRVVALAAFNGRLVIFGKKNILIYRDAAASTTAEGVNPNSSSFGLEDTIEGVGLVGRDAVEVVGNDLVFLSKLGVTSLGRVLEYEKTPLSYITRNIDPALSDDLAGLSSDANVDMTYHEDEALLLLKIQTNYYYLDPRTAIVPQGGDERREPILRASTWDGIAYHQALSGVDGKLRFAQADGQLGEYGGYLDGTSQYQMEVLSTWLNFGTENEKILKRMLVFANTELDYQVTLKWGWDYSDTFNTSTFFVTSSGVDASEWNVAEWGEGLWSGDQDAVLKGATQGSGKGAYLKVGFLVSINNEDFALNAILLQLKGGRLTRGN